MFLFVNTSAVFATPGVTTYQAKIVKPDGYPLESSNVNFRFTILDPAGSCILYTETYSSVNMASTGGLISFSLGSGVKTYPASATTFAEVFSNITPNLSCDAGGPGTYSPGANDIRKIVMQFHDGTGWQTLPAMSINAVPYAMYATEAQKISGLPTCGAGQALGYNGVSFSCEAVGGGGVTSSTIIAALGYEPVQPASITSLVSVGNNTLPNFGSYALGNNNTQNTGGGGSNDSILLGFNNNIDNGGGGSNNGYVIGYNNRVYSNGSGSNEAFIFGSNNNVNYSGFVIGRGVSAPATNAIVIGNGYQTINVMNNNRVGIGTSSPVTTLDIVGGVRIGAESTTCAPALAGTLRYNASNVEYCNGTSWQAFGVSGAGINNFNGSTSGTQTLATGTGGTAPNIVTANGVHTLNIPNASTGSVTAGLISNADYTTFTNKITSSAASIAQVLGYVPADNAVSGTYAQKANNLSDLTNVATARTNLGLGTFATASSIDLGSASATGTLAIARLPSFSGDATIAAASNTIILSNSGVTAGAYTKVTVDSKGRVTSSSALASSDVTTALGYTPASASASTQWTTSGTNIYYNTGNVGVGTAAPQTKLDVSGGVRIGMESAGCGAALAGTVRYNAGVMQYCNGTTWESIITGYTNSNDSIFIGSGTTQTGTSSNNTALGVTALASLTGGSENIAIGNEALYSNTSGYANTAIGWESLYANTTGGNNTAVGNESMAVNTTGYSNSALGSWALYRNTTGGYNTAVGESVLDYNSSGQYNVGLGMTAGRYNTSGHFNTFLGTNAGRGQGINLSDVSGSTIVGYGAGINILTGADGNTLLGYRVGDNITTGAKNIIIGYDIDATTATASNTLNIGNLIFGFGVNGVGTTVSTGNVGIGVSAPAAKLHLAAGTSSNASLKLTSGTLLTSPQSGTIEYDGFNFYVTDSTNTRRTIATGSSAGTIDNASNINSSGNITMTPTGSVVVSSTTASTNSSTGALVVKGGLGVAGNINTAGNLNVSGSSVIDGSLKLSNMTSGSVLFAGANGTVTQDNANFYWDGANRRLGIGTSSPTEALQIANGGLRVNGAIGATNVGGVYLDWNSGANIGRVIAGNASTSVLTFSTNTGGATSERMRIDSSGNVGIGTTSPAAALHVNSSSGAPSLYLQNTSTSLPYLQFQQGGFIQSMDADGSLRMRSPAGSGFLVFDTNGANERMRINSTGNVGIGTTSPGAKLHVSGSTLFQNGGADGNRAQGVTINIGGGAYVSGTDPSDSNRNLALTTNTNNTGVVLTLRNTARSIFWDIVGQGTGNDRLDFNTYNGGAYSTKFSLEGTTGNVGIGTSTPLARLDTHVNFSSPISGTIPGFSLQNDGNVTSGSGMTIDTGQGMGLTNIVGGAKIKSDGTGYTYLGARGAARILLGDGSLSLFTGNTASGTTDGPVTWSGSGSEALFINSFGNVGIATTAPTEKLEVSGSLKVTGEIYGQKSWGFKKGPSSYVSDYTNAWTSGGGAGSSIDCTSSANGCTILKSGTYEIRCVQRANSTTSTFVGIALNGDRTALESRADAVWTHDHALGSGQYSESNFMGTLTAGNFITCGPAAANSTYMTYGAPSYNGSITVKRID